MTNDNRPIKGKKPRHDFVRYEWYKCKKLGMKWRRPRGLHSKVRQGWKAKPPQVNIGYGTPAKEACVLIHNINDLKPEMKNKHVILASGIGLRLVNEISKKAEQFGIMIINKEKIPQAKHRIYMIAKQRAERAKEKTEGKKEEKKTEPKEQKSNVIKAASIEEATKVAADVVKKKLEEKSSEQSEQVRKHVASTRRIQDSSVQANTENSPSTASATANKNQVK